LLHFFRSKAYGYGELLAAWQRYVISQGVAVELQGRIRHKLGKKWICQEIKSKLKQYVKKT
jgi:hypothetical protein